MKESLKICKSFVCGCGKEYSLEISTNLVVENMILEVSCPSCGDKNTVTADSFFSNKASSSSSQGSSYSSGSSSDSGSSPLSFMDSMEGSSGTGYESSDSDSDSSEDSGNSEDSDSSVTSGSSDTLTEIDEDVANYKDMFGED